MDSNKELLEIIKYFGEIIKDLNSSFNSLSIAINGLTQQIDKLPKLESFDMRLNMVETKFYAYLEKQKAILTGAMQKHSEVMKNLESLVEEKTTHLIQKIEVMEKSIANSKINEIELKKQEIELKKTEILANTDIKKETISNKQKIIAAIIGGLGAIAVAVIAAWNKFGR